MGWQRFLCMRGSRVRKEAAEQPAPKARREILSPLEGSVNGAANNNVHKSSYGGDMSEVIHQGSKHTDKADWLVGAEVDDTRAHVHDLSVLPASIPGTDGCGEGALTVAIAMREGSQSAEVADADASRGIGRKGSARNSPDTRSAEDFVSAIEAGSSFSDGGIDRRDDAILPPLEVSPTGHNEETSDILTGGSAAKTDGVKVDFCAKESIGTPAPDMSSPFGTITDVWQNISNQEQPSIWVRLVSLFKTSSDEDEESSRLRDKASTPSVTQSVFPRIDNTTGNAGESGVSGQPRVTGGTAQVGVMQSQSTEPSSSPPSVANRVGTDSRGDASQGGVNQNSGKSRSGSLGLAIVPDSKMNATEGSVGKDKNGLQDGSLMAHVDGYHSDSHLKEDLGTDKKHSVADEVPLKKRTNSSRITTEHVINRKLKQLYMYIDEELLFKAYQYLGILEHQLETRLMVLNSLEDKALREFIEGIQTQLNDDIKINNMKEKVGMAHQMMNAFHLEHLKAICDDPRLSFTESISLLLQMQGSGCCGIGNSNSYIAGNGTPLHLVIGLGSGAVGEGRCMTANGMKTSGIHDCSHEGNLHNYENSLSSGNAVAGRITLRDDVSMIPERKTSATKIKQGLRNMSRKMTLTKRPSISGKMGSVKKVISLHKHSADQEGWIREKGKYLDLCYRVEKDTSVSIKVRGKLPCALFEVLAILNETDLAGNWAPFFKSSEKIHTYSRASQLIRQVFDYPLLGSKETILFSFGINALEECGCIMIFCRSPPENATEYMGRSIPPRGKVTRIQSANLTFLLYPINEGRQTTMELYGNFYHGIRYVPMRMITFVVKKVVRGVFVSIAKQCQHFKASPYKERVETNPEIYEWMKERIEDFVIGDSAHHFKALESISLASFNYEDFQD